MYKKLISIFLVIAFFGFVTASAFADYDEEEAENDRQQQRIVLACIGLVALVGIIFMLNKMDSNSFLDSSLNSINDDKKLNLVLGFDNITSPINDFNNQENQLNPTLKVSYNW